MSERICVAVMNAEDELMELVCEALQERGFDTVAIQVVDAKKRPDRIREIYRERDPRVIMFDVAPPYERNWSFLDEIRAWPESKGRHFVVTSTNPATLKKNVDEARGDIIELVGKPYDLEEIVRAICAKVGDVEGCGKLEN